MENELNTIFWFWVNLVFGSGSISTNFPWCYWEWNHWLVQYWWQNCVIQYNWQCVGNQWIHLCFFFQRISWKGYLSSSSRLKRRVHTSWRYLTSFQPSFQWPQVLMNSWDSILSFLHELREMKRSCIVVENLWMDFNFIPLPNPQVLHSLKSL